MKTKSKKGEIKPKEFPPRIVIKFRDSLHLPYEGEEEIQNYLKKNNIIPWKELLEKFPGIKISRLFTSLKPGEIIKLVNDIQKENTAYAPPNFLTCYAIDCPYEINTEELVLMLLSFENIEDAYIESDPVPPACTITGSNPKCIKQGYLNPAPKGIDARYAWTVNGGCGNGNVRFIDIEPGWILNHVDIIDSGASLIWGNESSNYKFHGAAVLGIILMQDNNEGGVGITYKINTKLIAQISSGGQNVINDAILKAVDNLNPGDILLLEAQVTETQSPRKQWPVETKSMTFNVIELATAKGIVVIEPAGNGSFDEGIGNNLDEFTSRNNKKILDRTSPDFKDSGAILVAAASESDTHGKSKSSNYGNRIDCFAWGSGVFTAGDSTTTYEENFNGTSSASAIIAGAAIAVQSIVEASGKRRLSPVQMRDILSNASNGTASRNVIGIMPDLKKIIEDVIPGLP